MSNKKWFKVTIHESYHASYKVLAADVHEATDKANDAVNNGSIDPTADCPDSYDRSVDIDGIVDRDEDCITIE